MNRFVTFLAAISLPVLFTQAALAHHSFAMFDLTKTVTIEGTVKEFAWTNPHVILWVVAAPKDGQPEQVWSLESTSPGNLKRIGWTKRTFNPGDRVRVDFSPLRSGETGGAFKHALLIDTGKEVEALAAATASGKPDIE